jgi:hypothetical protein
MNLGVLGTGVVGETIATKLVALGHTVKMGSRTATNEKAAAWVKAAGPDASTGTFADAAAHGELVFLCTKGEGTLDAVAAAGADALRGKVLVDISNPLDFSKGMPPSLFISNTDSLGEQVQRALPDTRVVKALNTISAAVMVDPRRIKGGDHTVFVSGNDVEAKAQVRRVLTEWFGWPDVVDLGDITTARGTEAYLLLWIRMWGALGTPDFNVRVIR